MHSRQTLEFSFLFEKKVFILKQQLGELCYRNTAGRTTGRQTDTDKRMCHYALLCKAGVIIFVGHGRTKTTSNSS